MTTYTAPPDQLNLSLGAADTLTVNVNGTAVDTTVNGGTLTVDGGAAVDTTVNSGTVALNAGTTADTTVQNDGIVDIHGGTAVNTTVQHGGTVDVTAGTATNTTVSDGGTLDVLGGTAVDLTLDGNSGSVVVNSPANLAGTITFDRGGNYTIQFESVVTNATFNGHTLTLTYGNDQTAVYDLKVTGSGFVEPLLLPLGNGTTQLEFIATTPPSPPSSSGVLGAQPSPSESGQSHNEPPPLLGIHHGEPIYHSSVGVQLVGVQHHEAAIHFGPGPHF
jgi:antigen 43